MILFSCLQCGMKFNVKDEHAGRASRCPTCKRPLNVPELLSSRAGQGSRYMLGEEIARGGMGAVLRGIDRDIRREVAIKFMLNDTDARQKARFVEEAQITGQLEHPNIVPVHELGVDAQKRLFFTMKMVRGRSLAQILDGLESGPSAEKEWSLSRLVNLLINVCHALAYAHSRNVIHRDLKPANIMVGDFGEVYVMDWGLAKVLENSTLDHASSTLAKLAGGPGSTDIQPNPFANLSSGSSLEAVATNPRTDGDLTQEGAIVGTPVYMPPEQARGQGVDQRSDIYSLGAILYALLTLQAPIEKTGNFLTLMLSVTEGNIKKPGDRAPDRTKRGLVPPELSAVAMKALANDPAKRYQSVEAFRGDLELFLDGRSVTAKDDSRREMATKFVKRNKGFSAATAVALVVLITVVAYFLSVNYSARLYAEEQERLAVKSKVDFEKSQREKNQAVRDSLPAFVGAGRQLANEGKVAEAQKQVEVALVYDSQNAAAHLLRGQILIAQKKWPQAQAELRLYLQAHPKDGAALALLDLTQRDMQDPAVLFALTEVLGIQKLYGLAGALTKDIELGVETRKPLHKQYHNQIEAAWPGLGKHLSLEANGNIYLHFQWQKQVTSLDPLKGMRLHKISLALCTNVADLEALRGMPLTYLDLSQCTQIEDLQPLQKMPMTVLELGGLDKVADLEPLRGMPLTRLGLTSCVKATDLGPLKGMPLKSLDLTSCGQLTDLRPLQGMSLLTELRMLSNPNVTDLEPLRGLSLKLLWLTHSRVKSLEPLCNMPLNDLAIWGCAAIQDLGPLQGMPLTSLQLQYCSGISDLTPLDGMALTTITLTPKYIQKGMDVLRRMESLKTIAVELDSYPADVFWKRYDAGDFRK